MPRIPFWTYETEQQKRKREAQQFDKWAESQRKPPPRPPWQPPEEPPGPPTMPIGPKAAAEFDQKATQELEAWKAALLGEPPTEEYQPWAPVASRTLGRQSLPSLPTGMEYTAPGQAGAYGVPAIGTTQAASTMTLEPESFPTAESPAPPQQITSLGREAEIEWRKSSPWKRAFLEGITTPETGEGEYGALVRTLRLGTADVARQIAGASKFMGHGEGAPDWERLASIIEKANPQEMAGWTGPESLLNPRFYTTTVARSMPSSLALAGVGMVVAAAMPEVGALTTMGAIGKVAQGVLTYGGAGVIQRTLESLMESGGTYNEAEQKGLSPQEAGEAARTTFAMNMGLAPLDALQIWVGLKGLPAPLKTQILKGLTDKLGDSAKWVNRALGFGASQASEGAEEMYQTAAGQMAMGEPVEMNREMVESGVVGAIAGAGQHLTGQAIQTVKEKGLGEAVKALPAPGLTVEDVSKKFYINDGRGNFQEVEAEPVSIPGYGQFDFFVHESPGAKGKYNVTEGITGALLTQDNTPEQAVAKLRDILKNSTPEQLANQVEKLVAQFGTSPRHADYQGKIAAYKVGDKVVKLFPGIGGVPLPVRGTVYQSKQGLRVRIDQGQPVAGAKTDDLVGWNRPGEAERAQPTPAPQPQPEAVGKAQPASAIPPETSRRNFFEGDEVTLPSGETVTVKNVWRNQKHQERFRVQKSDGTMEVLTREQMTGQPERGERRAPATPQAVAPGEGRPNVPPQAEKPTELAPAQAGGTIEQVGGSVPAAPLRGNAAREQADRQAREAIQARLAQATDYVYVSPQFREEVGGKQHLVNVGYILKDLGAESDPTRLNYYRMPQPPAVSPTEAKPEAAAAPQPEAGAAEPQQAEAPTESDLQAQLRPLAQKLAKLNTPPTDMQVVKQEDGTLLVDSTLPSGKHRYDRVAADGTTTGMSAKAFREGRKAVEATTPAPELAAGEPEMAQAVTSQATAKEPWQMTRNEYMRSLPPGKPNPHRKGSTAAVKYEERQRAFYGDLMARHKPAIEQALSAGLPVPQEVLEDYPDLQGKATEEAQTPAVGPKTTEGRLDMEEWKRSGLSLTEYVQTVKANREAADAALIEGQAKGMYPTPTLRPDLDPEMAANITRDYQMAAGYVALQNAKAHTTPLREWVDIERTRVALHERTWGSVMDRPLMPDEVGLINQARKNTIDDLKYKRLANAEAGKPPATQEQVDVIAQYWGTWRIAQHKRLVQQALSERRAVPEAVLKDYPDLEPKAEAPTTLKAEGETREAEGSITERPARLTEEQGIRRHATKRLTEIANADSIQWLDELKQASLAGGTFNTAELLAINEATARRLDELGGRVKATPQRPERVDALVHQIEAVTSREELRELRDRLEQTGLTDEEYTQGVADAFTKRQRELSKVRTQVEAAAPTSEVPAETTKAEAPAPRAPRSARKAMLQSVRNMVQTATDQELTEARGFWDGRNEPEALAIVDAEIERREAVKGQPQVETPLTEPATTVQEAIDQARQGDKEAAQETLREAVAATPAEEPTTPEERQETIADIVAGKPDITPEELKQDALFFGVDLTDADIDQALESGAVEREGEGTSATLTPKESATPAERYTANQFRADLTDKWGLDQTRAEAVYAIVEARARVAGETVDEYVGKRIARTTKGEKPGEGRTFLQPVPVDVALRIPIETQITTAPEFVDAVAHTPDAKLTDNGLQIRVVRYQLPSQAGATSGRTGVFYLPASDKNVKFYRTGKNAYGGSERIEGETLIRRPLVAKGATGGAAPKAAYDMLKGKGAYERMRDDALKVYGWGSNRGAGLTIERARQFLNQYGGNSDLADEMVAVSGKGNQLAYALQEHIVAAAARDAGYDAIVGYSKRKDGTHFISEIFDLREADYPDAEGYFRLHERFDPSILFQDAKGTEEEIAVANRTARAAGAVSGKAITPRYVEVSGQPGETVLDFGSGPKAVHTQRLRASGLNVTAYEFGVNVVPGVHDPQALSRQYDIVMASNVLNVQSSEKMLDETLDDLAKAVRPDGRLVANLPMEPRKMAITASLLEQKLKERFKYVRRVGGTRQAPLLEASNRPLALRQDAKGAAELADDGRIILRALESPDVSTVVHELAHVFRRDLSSPDLQLTETWAGVIDGNWTADAEEKFARGFERYLRDGSAPDTRLQSVFAQFKQWLTEIYRAIKGSPINVRLTPEVQGVFDRLLAEPSAITAVPRATAEQKAAARQARQQRKPAPTPATQPAQPTGQPGQAQPPATTPPTPQLPTPLPAPVPNPPAPGKLLPVMPASDTIKAVISKPGALRTAAQALRAVPGAKKMVDVTDPGLIVAQEYEYLPVMERRMRDIGANITRDAMLQLDAVKIEGVKVKGNRYVEGVKAPQGKTTAQIDVIEAIGGDTSAVISDAALARKDPKDPVTVNGYTVPASLLRWVRLANRLADELDAQAKAAGAKIPHKEYPTGHHFTRVVEVAHGIRKRGPHAPDQSRHYDSQEAGIQADIEYSEDVMANADVQFTWLMRKLIGARMAKLAEPLGKMPSDLIDQTLHLQAEVTKKALQVYAKYDKTVRDIRMGKALYYDVRTPLGPVPTLLKALQDIEQVQPGTVAKVEAAAKLKGQDRIKAFEPLQKEARVWRTAAMADFLKAKRRRANALADMADTEWAPAEKFGGAPGEYIGVAKVPTTWARGRLFPRETADYLRQAFKRDQSQILKAVSSFSSGLRTMKAAWDLGAVNIQLLPMMAYPEQWAKGTWGMVRYTISPEGYAALMTENLLRDDIKDAIENGLTIEGIEYTEALERGGIIVRGVHKAGAISGREVERFIREQVLRRTEMAYEAPLNIAKLELVKALYPKYKAQDRVADLATLANNMTGTRSSLATGLGTTQRTVESTFLFFSPRYIRASLALIGDALQGGSKAWDARRALGGMAAVMLLVPYALWRLTDQEPPEEFLDPTSPKFLSFKAWDRWISFGGFYRSLASLLGSSLKAAERNPEVFLDVKDRRNSPLTRWWQGRTSPITSIMWDVVTERKFTGERVPWPRMTIEKLAEAAVPMWASSGVSFPATAIEFVGLRASEMSPAQKRDELRERLAQQEYGRPWYAPREEPKQGLSRTERMRLEKKYPELVTLTERAEAVGAERGYQTTLFWQTVEKRREPMREQMAEELARLRRGEISGNEYRDRVHELERSMAQVPKDLKVAPQFAEVPLTQDERRSLYGSQYQESQHPVDRFIDNWYMMTEIATREGSLNMELLMEGRNLLKGIYEPAVVTEALEYINQNKDPEYVKAQELMGQYMAMPKWVGVDAEYSRKLEDAQQQMRAMRNRLPPNATRKTDRAIAMLAAEQGAEMAALAREAESRPLDPRRKQFWFEHQDLLDRFYSDLRIDETGTGSVSLPAQPNVSQLQSQLYGGAP